MQQSRRGAARAIGLTKITVMPVAGQPARGKLLAGPLTIPCALGPAGLTHRKREGDGATPIGRFGLERLWIRRDRIPALRPLLHRRLTQRQDGWCDAPGSACYNRPVRLPHRAGAETLWRTDALYDLVLVIDYNRKPIRPGRGSAIFLHVARPDLAPTAGCIAIAKPALLRLAPRLSQRTRLVVGPGGPRRRRSPGSGATSMFDGCRNPGF